MVVNRGFVPEGRQVRTATRTAGGSGSTIVGAMRWPEPRQLLLSGRMIPRRDLWFVRDHRAIAAAKGVGRGCAVLVELEAPQPPGGLPRAGALKVSLRNEHLQYAITWYGLAVVVAVMFAFWLRGRRQCRRSAMSRLHGRLPCGSRAFPLCFSADGFSALRTLPGILVNSTGYASASAGEQARRNGGVASIGA